MLVVASHQTETLAVGVPFLRDDVLFITGLGTQLPSAYQYDDAARTPIQTSPAASLDCC